MLTILQTEDMPFSFKLDNGIKKILLCYRLKNKKRYLQFVDIKIKR